MPLTITIDLLTGSYDAAETDDRSRAEWPPHPARLFCALVDISRSEAERQALIWLEAQAPPNVRASLEWNTSSSSSFVVSNRIEPKGGSQTHPARTNQMRARSRTHPRSSGVEFVWPAAEPDPEILALLDGLCRRVPYVGRSTGVAVLSAHAGAMLPDQMDDPVWEPCEQFDDAVSLRVPYLGYLTQLDELYEQGRPAWQASRYLWYRVRRPSDAASIERRPEPSVYRDVVILRFVGMKPEGRLATRFTERLRAAVLSRAGDDSPPALHGHGADGRPHVAFLALPNVALDAVPQVGQDKADGHLLGLAVAIPDLPEEERRAVLRAVLSLRRTNNGDGDGGAVTLRVPQIGQVELLYAPGLVRPYGATPERWRRGSRLWTTATPMLFDRFPKPKFDAEDIVRASVRQLGMPDPVRVDVSLMPLHPGAVAMRPIDLPKKYKGRPYQHVTLEFARPVAGPVMIGAGRYLGLGLMAPLRVRAAKDCATVNDGSVVEAAEH